MDRREERQSDAELLLSLLPHGAEFRKGRKKNMQRTIRLFFLIVKLARYVLSGGSEKLWSRAPDVRIVSLARAVFELSGRTTRAVLLRHILATFPFDALMLDFFLTDAFVSDSFVQFLTPSWKFRLISGCAS